MLISKRFRYAHLAIDRLRIAQVQHCNGILQQLSVKVNILQFPNLKQHNNLKKKNTYTF